MLIEAERHTRPSSSVRARQVSAMFDVPPTDLQALRWSVNAPLTERPWNVGLIVGPSGSGKTTILRDGFGTPAEFTWTGDSTIDGFDIDDVQRIAEVCQAVGFNTIPAWLRPFDVLSMGEQFRVTLARTLLETPDDQPILMDEFTSVVDRQVAKIGAHAAQKYVRRTDRQLIVATCHYDVIDWLQPDWVIDAADQSFTWRSVQPRPTIDACIAAVPYDVWTRFAPYHYLTAELNRTARCYALHIDGQPVAFAGVMRRPHPKAKDIMGVSRLVTLPDWQGLGLAMRLVAELGAAYKVVGERLRTYPAHPALIRSFDKSPDWAMKQRPGYENTKGAVTTGKMARSADNGTNSNTRSPDWRHGSRPCAIFEYAGPPHPEPVDALNMLSRAHVKPLRLAPRYRAR